MTAPDAGPPQGDSQEIVVYDPQPVPAMANLFGAENPAEVVARSTEVAGELTKILEAQRLYKEIQGKRHVLVDGWTLLGSMLGVFPVVVWSRKLENGWEARVEARTLAGNVVGAAEAECLRAEKRWSSADDYAVRSMAQTRATSKALRGPLGFIVHLAGFAPTPEAEIPSEPVEADPNRPRDNAQNAKFRAILSKLDQTKLAPEGYGDWTSWAKQWVLEQYQVKSTKDLTYAQAEVFIGQLRRMEREAPEVPFG